MPQFITNILIRIAHPSFAVPLALLLSPVFVGARNLWERFQVWRAVREIRRNQAKR